MFSIHGSLSLSVLLFISTSTALVTPFNETMLAGAYTLRDNFNSDNFFNSFDFFTDNDPTHGFVNYLSQSAASSSGIINNNNNQIYLGVDHTTWNPSGRGRNSVRPVSRNSYTHGLFIADIAHMPASICGTWPAFWLVGPNWPYQGEIDVIEGVNTQTTDSITLHTSPGCTINNAGSQSGTTLVSGDCNNNNAYNGCGQSTSAPNAYGTPFNNNGGGVYALGWDSSAIKVWFFPRNSIPWDINNGTPQPQNWGAPLAAFNGNAGCNLDSHFSNQQIVFDTTFCGDWAGNVWNSNPQCSGLSGTCAAYVAQNPSAFTKAYWLINSVKVYQN